MSAADKREELEAYVWRLFARRRKVPEGQLVASVLAAADKYAEAVADVRITGHVSDRLAARERREAAAAEIAESYGGRR